MTRGSPRRTYKKYINPSEFKNLDKFKEPESGYYTELNEKLADLLENYNARDVEQIKKHLETIKNKLESEFEGSIELLYGGSVKKSTYVDGLSDIDMLVLLNRSELSKENPENVIKIFKESLAERFPKSDIHAGDLAATIKFKSDGNEIQLLPSIKTKTGFRIMEPETKNWSNILKPDKFAKNLTEVNTKNNQKVVPVIKLYKPINEKAPKNIKMSGYHIEALATEIFKDYTGPKTYSKMLVHFCQKAKGRVLKPIGETTGQTDYIDSKFGKAYSNKRKKLSSYLERTTRKMKLAISTSSINDWVQLLE